MKASVQGRGGPRASSGQLGDFLLKWLVVWISGDSYLEALELHRWGLATLP